MEEHVYTSRLGQKFLNWHTWVELNESPQRFEEFERRINSGEMNEMIEQLFVDWVKDQQITSHRVYNSEGKLISYDEF